MKSASLVLAFCTVTGCSAAPVVASSSAALDDIVLGDSVSVRGCTYTIGTGVDAPPFPPVYTAFVERSGNPRHCPAGQVVLGTSYSRPTVSIAAGQGQIVADFTSKSTPSGEAHTQLFVDLIDADLTIEKSTEIAAMSPDFFHPQLGNVWNGALDPHGNDLVVTGDNDGILPGDEDPTEGQYRVTLDHFFSH